MQISVKSNIKQVQKEWTRLQKKQLPFATAVALTSTAWLIAGRRGKKGDLELDLPKYIDRPRKTNAFYAKKATKQSLTAEVRFKDSGRNPGTQVYPASYYYAQVFGGPRRAKAHEKSLRRMGILGSNEFTVPGTGMMLNKFGNLTGGTYSKILADVNATYTGGDDIGSGFGQRTTKAKKKKYFYHPTKPRGIWIRAGKRRAYPALMFIKQPQYKKRFPMQRLVDDAVDRRFTKEFRKAMAYALRTAR